MRTGGLTDGGTVGRTDDAGIRAEDVGKHVALCATKALGFDR